MSPDAEVRIEHLTDSSAAEWDGFVAGSREASLYHRYRWRTLVREVFGHDTHYLAARTGDRITGVLPLVRLKSRLFGDFLVSMPYFNYGGIVAESDMEGARLLRASADLALELGVSHVELRHRLRDCSDWPCRTDKVTMLLDLPADPDALWKGCGSKVRAQVNRPQREGATCEQGGAELLDHFYAVFAENMRDLGTPVYPRRFFGAILAAFPDAARLFIVRLASVPVAAGFVLSDGRTLEIPWASSLRRANAIGVNMLLYWRILEYACASGHAVFDFGRSTRDSGPYRFKKQWGAVPQQLYWHYWLREGGDLPELNPGNAKFSAAIAIWRHLPLAVTNRLGPLIIRNLP